MVYRTLFLSVLILILVACGTNNTPSVNKAETQLPSSLQKLALGDNGVLRAFIIIDGDETNKIEMLIDPTGTGSASVTLPELTRTQHAITIKYEYTLAGISYDVAVANRDVDLTSGSGSLAFAVGDYVLDAFDDDEDGYNNAIELKAGTNLNDTNDAPFPRALALNVNLLIDTEIALPVSEIDTEGHILTFIVVTQPQNGSLNGIVYTPNTGYVGLDSFTYQVNDGIGNSTISQININVTQPQAYITTWKTDNQGITNTGPNQIKIGTNPNLVYNFNISWGDGKVDEGITKDIIHTYDVAGTYTVEIRGRYPQSFFGRLLDSLTPFSNYDASKLVSIDQWGSIRWESMAFAYYQCNNVKGIAQDIPNLENVIDMSNMFFNASIFNQDIANWNVSAVSNMSGLFNSATLYNKDIGSWDVSSVTDMSNLFRDARNFNQNISTWNVSSVKNMSGMFHLAIVFNQDIGNWNVSSVIDMTEMFLSANDFNQNIRSWNVSSVTSMESMFRNMNSFNQDIGGWDVSSVRSMFSMFSGDKSKFNQNLSQWDVSSVEDMAFMFSGNGTFDQDISSWNVSFVFSMAGMFVNSRLSTDNYDALLIAWSKQNLQNNINFDAGSSTYSVTAVTARDILTNDFSWTIIDGGQTQ